MPQVGYLPRQQAFISGVVAPGSVLRFYRTGSSTPQNAYTDSALSNAVTSLTADSAGLFAKWYLNPNAAADYRYTLETSAGAVYYTEDNVARFPATQADIGAALYPITAAETAADVTPSDYSEPAGDIERMGAEDGSNSSTAIQNTIAPAELSNGAAVLIPYGRFVIDAALTSDATLSVYGTGYYSELELAGGGSTLLPLLIQNTSAAINGVRLRDFRIDGNSGGEFNAGLLQLNNAVGFVADGLWIENGSRASGANGVNGIAMAASGGGAAPSGVVINCVLQGQSKAAINISTGCDGVVAAFNRSLSNTGNGTTPGIQLQDAFRNKVIGNTVSGNQGRGIYPAFVSGATDAYNLIAFNHVYGNGTGTSEGDGVVYVNQVASTRHARSVITENIIANNGDGLTAGANGVYVANVKSVDVCRNYIHDNALHGVLVDADGGIDGGHIRVNDNTIDANNTKENSVGAGVYVTGTFDHLEICRNKISNSDAASGHRYGIYFESDCVINDLVVKDNFITETVTAPYLFAGTFTRFDFDLDARAQTTDATQTTVFNLPIADNSAAFIRFKVLGVKSDGSDRAMYEYVALVYRDGGTATLQGGASTAIFSPVESDALWGAAIAVSSNNVLCRVTGVAATTVNWRCKLEAYSI